MKFCSTSNDTIKVTLSEAILDGLAEDGGLFVPEDFTKIKFEPKHDVRFGKPLDVAGFASLVLEPFFEGDPLADHLQEVAKKAFDFPIPLSKVGGKELVLELFHGPTSAFKDVGAQFLRGLFSFLPRRSPKPRLVLVATSGDTGGAVGAAFTNHPDIRVAILYPKGKISPRQEQQLICWGKNVAAFAVEGNFDDCQKMVKTAIQDKSWNDKWELISANSINLGRLLPQMIYYAKTSVDFYRDSGKEAQFIIPTGNLGNGVACYWAKQIGFPIADIALALNANQTLLEYSKTGVWNPSQSIPTLANAMDVGHPSNFARLRDLIPDRNDWLESSAVVSANDQQISKTIEDVYHRLSYEICPHTATAFFAKKQLNWSDAICVATAHPGKFDTIVEPLIQKTVDLPPALEKLLSLKGTKIDLPIGLEPLEDALTQIFGQSE